MKNNEKTCYFQLIPSPCCILSQTAYPWTISPEDSHCVFVPTKYNSHWMQVIKSLVNLSLLKSQTMLQGCLPAITTILTANTSTVILVIIILLSVESIVIILAVCLCSLQHTGTHKNIHTVIVRGQGAGRLEK